MQGLSMSKHRGTHAMTFEQIKELQTPEATGSWKPVPHAELIERLRETITRKGFKIEGEEFGVGRKGQRIFGIMKLVYGLDNGAESLNSGYGHAALGFRQSLDKTMSIQICAGLSVFVCDNLVFRGDLIALRRKHTSGLDLQAELDEATGKFIVHLGALQDEVEELKKQEITEDKAKAVMHDVFTKKLMPIKFLQAVDENYFNPPHAEFAPRNMWSLHNAFTECAKSMPITTRWSATQKIGQYFGLTSK